ncbi:MAG: carboxypeptidase regulatory-like domain-containing protein [Thermoplasmatota archaeon]
MMRRLAAAISLLVIVSALPLAAADSAYVTGRVVDHVTRGGVPGATVTLGTLTTHTASDGTFSFAAAPAGNATRNITAPGYASRSDKITIYGSSLDWGDLDLTRLPTVNGTVMEDISGGKLAGVTVTLTKNETTLTATTNAGGSFVFSGVPNGTWAITFTRPGYVTLAASRTIGPNGADLGPFRMKLVPPPVAFTGYVITSANGSDVADPSISFTQSSVTRNTTGDNVGTFHFASLAVGYWSYSVSAAGFTAKSGRLYVSANATSAIFPLDAYVGPHAVTGRLVNATTGVAITHAYVAVAGQHALTGTDGKFSFTVPGGIVTLNATRARYDPRSVRVDARGASADLGDVALSTSVPARGDCHSAGPSPAPPCFALVIGRVVGVNGTISGAAVDLVWGGESAPNGGASAGRRVTTVSDGLGEFSANNLSTGPWTIYATSGTDRANLSYDIDHTPYVIHDIAVTVRVGGGFTARIVGTVVDAATGAPIAGVRVSAGDTPTLSAADGSFALDVASTPLQMVNSTWPIEFTKVGYDPREIDVPQTAGPAPNVIDLHKVSMNASPPATSTPPSSTTPGSTTTTGPSTSTPVSSTGPAKTPLSPLVALAAVALAAAFARRRR